MDAPPLDGPTTRYTVDGKTVCARESGKPGKPIALLIHGWSSSWYALSPILPILQKRYHCLAVDLPGFGDSPRLDEPATIQGYATLLTGLLQQLSDRPAVLVGHSMGGMISLKIALDNPDLVERMVLLCPTITGKLSLFINMFVSPIVALENFWLTDWFVSKLEPFMFDVTDRIIRPASFATRSHIKEEHYLRLRADIRRNGQGRVRAECFTAMKESDLRGKLNDVAPPTLVIWGMEDNTVPLRDASILVEEWPDVDLRIIPQAGHWPQFETPELTRRYIEGFLGRPLKLLNFLSDF